MLKKLIFYFSLFLLLAFLCPGQTQAPKNFQLHFSDLSLVHSPNRGSPQISALGIVLSYGQDWEVRQLKPFLYHIKQEFWKNFFWKVNSSRKEVYRVTNGSFGALGGKDFRLNINVKVVESTSRPAVSETAPSSRVYGRITDGATGRGLPGLTVQAMDKDMMFDDLLGTATTDRRGHFEIRYTYTKEEVTDKRPDIFLKILNSRGQLIHQTDIRYEAKLTEEFVVTVSRR